MYQIYKIEGTSEKQIGRPKTWGKAFAKYEKLEAKENQAAIEQDRSVNRYAIGEVKD